MTDLAAIVARDAEWEAQPDGSLAYTWVNVRSGQRKVAPHAMDRDGPADRRALLVLLRETRDAMAGVIDRIDYINGTDARQIHRRAVDALFALAALDTEVPA